MRWYIILLSYECVHKRRDDIIRGVRISAAVRFYTVRRCSFRVPAITARRRTRRVITFAVKAKVIYNISNTARGINCNVIEWLPARVLYSTKRTNRRKCDENVFRRLTCQLSSNKLFLRDIVFYFFFFSCNFQFPF